jgi:hypothetical protein
VGSCDARKGENGLVKKDLGKGDYHWLQANRRGITDSTIFEHEM